MQAYGKHALLQAVTLLNICTTAAASPFHIMSNINSVRQHSQLVVALDKQVNSTMTPWSEGTPVLVSCGDKRSMTNESCGSHKNMMMIMLWSWLQCGPHLAWHATSDGTHDDAFQLNGALCIRVSCFYGALWRTVNRSMTDDSRGSHGSSSKTVCCTRGAQTSCYGICELARVEQDLCKVSPKKPCSDEQC